MRNKMELIKNCIAELLNYILALAIMTVVMRDFLNYWPGTGRLLILIAVPICLYLIREYIKNGFLFLMLHFFVVLAVIGFFSHTVSEKVLFGLVTAVFIGFSIYRRLSSQIRGMGVIHPVVMAVALFILYLVDRYKGAGRTGGYLIQFMIMYMAGYFLYYYLEKFLQFIHMNCKVTENVPVKHIFSSSFGLILLFILGMTGITFVSVNKEMIDELATVIRSGILAFLGFLGDLFIKEGAIEVPQEALVIRDTLQMDMPLTPDAEPSVLVQILDYILYLMGNLAVLVFALAVVIAVYKLIRRAFSKGQSKYISQEEVFVDKVESLKKEKSMKRNTRKKFSFAGTPEMMIRRQYYKAMTDKKVASKVTSDKEFLSGTARENSARYFEMTKEKKAAAQTFSGTYEKARYGQNLCSREEVKQMKRSREILLKN